MTQEIPQVAGMINIYTDGGSQDNPGPGGWAAVIEHDGQKRELSGRESWTTNNRMEVTAAIKGLEATPEGSSVTIHSDSRYLVTTMSRGWKRNVNTDLWDRLDALVANRSVAWQWVRGHAGHPQNERADQLASGRADPVKVSDEPRLTHLDEQAAPAWSTWAGSRRQCGRPWHAATYRCSRRPWRSFRAAAWRRATF